MDLTERFRTLVERPEVDVALDEVTLLAGAHASALSLPDDEETDAFVTRWLGVLDELAASCPQATLASVGRHLFVTEAFAGNADDYYDPRNSYLHEVLGRRLGIPITLAIVAIEVGRRLDIPLRGIGMPAHFLVGNADDEGQFLDPFAGGSVIDRRGAERLFRESHGPEATFDARYLAPVGSHAIVARVLANLKQIHLTRGDRVALARVLELRVLVPGVASTERRELAGALAAGGRFDKAADELDVLAALEQGAGDEAGATATRHSAIRVRARLN